MADLPDSGKSLHGAAVGCVHVRHETGYWRKRRAPSLAGRASESEPAENEGCLVIDESIACQPCPLERTGGALPFVPAVHNGGQIDALAICGNDRA